MSSTTNRIASNIWTVTEAKSRLSELLRLASNKPQYIGTKKTYVVIPQKKWQEVNQPKAPIGQWLVGAIAGTGELELPNRDEPEREALFQ